MCQVSTASTSNIVLQSPGAKAEPLIWELAPKKFQNAKKMVESQIKSVGLGFTGIRGELTPLHTNRVAVLKKEYRK